MSIFRTRRTRGHRLAPDRAPATFDAHDVEPSVASVEGVTLDGFVMFLAMVGRPGTASEAHETIAASLGFPAGRHDLIRNAWMTRIYSSPSLAREFGERLDAARSSLVSY